MLWLNIRTSNSIAKKQEVGGNTLWQAMISEIYLHPKETLIEVETASQAHGQKAEVQPQCPEDKESAIVEALRHFKMIQKN